MLRGTQGTIPLSTSLKSGTIYNWVRCWVGGASGLGIVKEGSGKSLEIGCGTGRRRQSGGLGMVMDGQCQGNLQDYTLERCMGVVWKG